MENSDTILQALSSHYSFSWFHFPFTWPRCQTNFWILINIWGLISSTRAMIKARTRTSSQWNRTSLWKGWWVERRTGVIHETSWEKHQMHFVLLWFTAWTNCSYFPITASWTFMTNCFYNFSHTDSVKEDYLPIHLYNIATVHWDLEILVHAQLR